ncbi:MAG: hypothetical protein LBB05_01490 [Puniceicoccales bacterium]|jgi:hypothetical protein|nr:hypothetical protein [Puniceicoccales bacterium]
MNASEEFLEEREEGEFVPEEQSVMVSSLIGSQSVAPDLTILGDLKDLANLTFGTRWSQDESSPRPPSDRPRNFHGRRPIRDRNDPQSKTSGSREFRETSGNREFREREGRPFRERHSAHFDDRRRENRTVFPPFEVQFYQEDTSFNLLLDEMRKNCKTYELFAVARLILQKPERFVAVVQRRPNREGVRLPFYLSLLDDWIFCSEHEAMSYIMQHHVEEFFDVVEEAVEAPKGRFTCVHRCGITKKLLSAPNYHRYRALLRAHFDAEIYSMTFERFVSKIETTKDEGDIQNWIQQMSRRVTYTPRAIDEAVTDLEPRDSLDGVKRYLLQYFRDRILREVTTIRIAGAIFESMPSRVVTNAIQFFLQRQRNFPFDTANNLRHRFRRAGFNIYRKGQDKIFYVCAVKRKFRSESDVFEANVQALINFLESHATVTLPIIKENYIEANHYQEKEVFGELDWLIREGYVVNYDDGTLFLNPRLIDRSDKARTKDESEKQSVIQLEKIETAIEKLSDGTLSISPQTTLAVSEGNLDVANGNGGDNENGVSPSKNTSTIDISDH